MSYNANLALLIMALTIYMIRLLPLVFLQKEITNNFVRSFLYYVPFVTLAVMTFPAILGATASPISGALALVVAIVVALINGDLFLVAISACVTVFLSGLFL